MDRSIRQDIEKYGRLAAMYGVTRPIVQRAWVVLLICVACVAAWLAAAVGMSMLLRSCGVVVACLGLALFSFVTLLLWVFVSGSIEALERAKLDLLTRKVREEERRRAARAGKLFTEVPAGTPYPGASPAPWCLHSTSGVWEVTDAKARVIATFVGESSEDGELMMLAPALWDAVVACRAQSASRAGSYDELVARLTTISCITSRLMLWPGTEEKIDDK